MSRRGLGFLLSTVVSVVSAVLAHLLGVNEAYVDLGLIVAGFTLGFAWLTLIVVGALWDSRLPKSAPVDPRLAAAAESVRVDPAS